MDVRAAVECFEPLCFKYVAVHQHCIVLWLQFISFTLEGAVEVIEEIIKAVTVPWPLFLEEISWTKTNAAIAMRISMSPCNSKCRILSCGAPHVHSVFIVNYKGKKEKNLST